MRVFYVRPSDNGDYGIEEALASLAEPPEGVDVALFRGLRVPLEPLLFELARPGRNGGHIRSHDPVEIPEEFHALMRQVAVIAEVRVNGRDLGTLWIAPFRVDITEAVKAGAELKMALATDLIWENQGKDGARVKGVVTDQGNFEAPMRFM